MKKRQREKERQKLLIGKKLSDSSGQKTRLKKLK
jgi:hypothetical protein